jgi:hypothetical protein
MAKRKNRLGRRELDGCGSDRFGCQYFVSTICIFCVSMYFLCLCIFVSLCTFGSLCIFCVVLCIFLFYVLFVLWRSLYCLCVYVYWTTATGWLPIAVNKYNISYHISWVIINFCVTWTIWWLIEQISDSQGLPHKKISIHDLALASKQVAEFFKTSKWETQWNFSGNSDFHPYRPIKKNGWTLINKFNIYYFNTILPFTLTSCK